MKTVLTVIAVIVAAAALARASEIARDAGNIKAATLSATDGRAAVAGESGDSAG